MKVIVLGAGLVGAPMARTTGYTATLALRMIADGLYTHKGISPPEYIGKYPACVEFMQSGLKQRGVVYRETVQDISASVQQPGPSTSQKPSHSDA